MKPAWLKKKVTCGSVYRAVSNTIARAGLHTICDGARCPNRGDCYARGHATFLIMGERCTRNCRFCAVPSVPIQSPDPSEPERVAETVARLGLGYAVITSVTRDDLGDGGAAHFVRTIREIRTVSPHTRIEVLVPDFRGDAAAIAALVEAAPDVIGHNLETVPRLYGSIRPEAEYRRSLMLLKTVRALDAGLATKSGIMLGLGETVDEVVAVLDDLISVGCTLLWLGQYLQPDPACTPVERYITPDEFDSLRDKALCMGFRGVASAPFVRSSYHAGELYEGLRTAALS